MTRIAFAAFVACLSLAWGSTAAAQVFIGRDAPRRGSIEVSGAGIWQQGFDLDPRTAHLSRAAAGQRFDLFTTEGDLQGFSGGRARVGVFLTRTASVEAGVTYARPTMSIRISGDAETADDMDATQRVQHYIFDGSVLFHVTQAAFGGGRGVPFFSVGAGHLRELHDGNELVETGTTYHGTGGVKYWFGGGRRRLGLRVEVGLTSRDGGAAGSTERRLVPMASGGVSYLF